MARHLQTPSLGGSTVTLDSLLGGPWITFGALRGPSGSLGCPCRRHASLLDAFGLAWAGLGFFWCTQGRRGSLQAQLRRFFAYFRMIFVTFPAVFEMLCHPGAWSRPRHRRGRRPHQWQESWSRFVCWFLSHLGIAWTIWDGGGVWLDNVAAMFVF